MTEFLGIQVEILAGVIIPVTTALGIITWSWWWVTAPIWIPLVATITIIYLILNNG